MADAGDYHRVYEVTITNLTRGQILSPPAVFTHRRGFRVFEAGKPASAEIVAVAEDGMNGPLGALLDGARQVSDHKSAAGPVPPFQSVTLRVRAGRRATKLTALGMLVVTNDAFFAVQGVDLPRYGTRTYRAVAYDAGSEGNSESCAHIPGPPCGSGGVRYLDNAEGYVHVHAGIHGIRDLTPAQHDWRNPVALITVKRVY